MALFLTSIWNTDRNKSAAYRKRREGGKELRELTTSVYLQYWYICQCSSMAVPWHCWALTQQWCSSQPEHCWCSILALCSRSGSSNTHSMIFCTKWGLKLLTEQSWGCGPATKVCWPCNYCTWMHGWATDLCYFYHMGWWPGTHLHGCISVDMFLPQSYDQSLNCWESETVYDASRTVTAVLNTPPPTDKFYDGDLNNQRVQHQQHE